MIKSNNLIGKLTKILTLTFFLLIYLTPNKMYAGGQCASDAKGNYEPTPGDCCTIPGGGIIDKCTANEFGRIDPNDNTQCKCVKANEELSELFTIINGILIPITIIIGLFIIISSGYKILTSQGDPQELQTGKENLTSAIIGLIFVLMAVSILRVIIKTLITGDTDPF